MLTLAEAIEADDILITVAGVERGQGLKGTRLLADSEVIRFLQRRNDVPQPAGRERWWVSRGRYAGSARTTIRLVRGGPVLAIASLPAAHAEGTELRVFHWPG